MDQRIQEGNPQRFNPGLLHILVPPVVKGFGGALIKHAVAGFGVLSRSVFRRRFGIMT